eukprot:COSAG02_NODE_18319_length_945_cov_182.109195_1_plen_68_part_10
MLLRARGALTASHVCTQIPDELVTYYLNRSGFNCPDDRVKRLIAVAAQKFISDIASEALSIARARSQH